MVTLVVDPNITLGSLCLPTYPAVLDMHLPFYLTLHPLQTPQSSPDATAHMHAYRVEGHVYVHDPSDGVRQSLSRDSGSDSGVAMSTESFDYTVVV
jgi:hypothetical protein